MKKTLIALAVAGSASFAQAEIEGLSMSATFGFESEYIFRGQDLGSNTFQSSVDASYMGAYAGIWSSMGAFNTNQPGSYGNEVDFYGGYALELDAITLDLGATAYTYQNNAQGTFGGGDTFEVYAGTSFDVVAEPSLYVYYDLDLEVWTFELAGGHSIEIAEDTSLDLGAYGGYAWNSSVAANDLTSFWYLGGTADVVYALAENAAVSIGGRVAWNDTLVNGGNNYSRTFLFWGASFTAGF